MDTNSLGFVVHALLQPGLNDWQTSNLLGYLSEVRNPSCGEMLADVVWTVTNQSVREQAIVSLAEIGDEPSLLHLMEFLGDVSMSNSHEHVLYMIGRIQNKESIDNLATVFLSSTNAGLRYAAARALAVIRQTGEQPERATGN